MNAYKCLPGNADDLVHKEILSEVVALYHQLNPSGTSTVDILFNPYTTGLFLRK